MDFFAVRKRHPIGLLQGLVVLTHNAESDYFGAITAAISVVISDETRQLALPVVDVKDHGLTPLRRAVQCGINDGKGLFYHGVNITLQSTGRFTRLQIHRTLKGVLTQWPEQSLVFRK